MDWHLIHGAQEYSFFFEVIGCSLVQHLSECNKRGPQQLPLGREWRADSHYFQLQQVVGLRATGMPHHNEWQEGNLHMEGQGGGGGIIPKYF